MPAKINTMYPRELEAKARDLTEKFPLLAIVGPRQSGKTTLSQKVFSNYQ